MLEAKHTDSFTYLLSTMLHRPNSEGKKVLSELLNIWEFLPPNVKAVVEAVQDVYSRPVKQISRAVRDYLVFKGQSNLEAWLLNAHQNDIVTYWEQRLNFILDEAKRIKIRNAFSKIDLNDDIDNVLKQIGELSKLSKYDESFFANIEDDIAEIIDGKSVSRIKTRYHFLDQVLNGGLPIGDVSVIAGSTGSGKSAFAINIANNILKSGEAQVTIYSLEMTAKTIVKRFASIYSGIPHNLLGGCDASKRALEFFADQYRKGNLKVRALTTNLTQIRNQAVVDSKWGEKPQVVIIDYTGLLDHKAKSSYERMTEISKELRQIALDANCAMIEVVQLNRAYKQHNDTSVEKRPPILSDMRDSGQIEQDASVVLMTHSLEDTDPENKWKPKEVWVRKNRDGFTDKGLSFDFKGETFEFREYVPN
jgi:replicative DNA helicase